MHIDMDAFFASVEQYRNHPELEGKPVCVGHDPRKGHGRGVVRAASYEARTFGIKSGMPVSKAYRLCPDAVFVSGSFQNYLEASDEFMDILRGFADDERLRRASIDEAYIETTEGITDYSNPKRMALEIQKTIKEKTRLPCSIGIARNMSVAKVATGMNKPFGITLVPQDQKSTTRFLAPLPVQTLNGVGSKTAERLEKHDIYRLGQIQERSVTELWPIMGKGSQWLYKRANGIDERPLLDNGPRIRKSISKDRTFMNDIEPESYGFVLDTIDRISRRIHEKLQKKKLAFRTVTVKIRYEDYSTYQRSKSIRVATDDFEMLQRLAHDIFVHERDTTKAVRLIGVKVSSLSETAAQCAITEFL